MAILEIEKLTKYYKNTKALSEVDLRVKRGEFVAVIGRSGAGKSTLLRCVNRMIEPSSGSVRFDGVDVRSLGRFELRRLRTRIGMIFQHFNLVPRQTVMDNVLHGRLGYKGNLQGSLGIFTTEEKAIAWDVIERLGLAEQANQRCDQLSGGQKQRVGIARALVQDPALILCDEPIASLDPGSSKVIMDHLHRITREMNITVLMNLHQVDVATRYADRVVGISRGEIVFEGEPRKLKKKTLAEIYGSEAEDILLPEMPE